MVSFWWDSVDQSTAVELLGVVVFSLVVGVVSRRGKSYKEMLGESVSVGYISVISIVGAVEV